MDSALLHHVIELRRPWLDDVMLFCSAIGAGGFIWVITALITAVFPHKRAAAWRMLLAVAFTFIVGDFVLKPISNRVRPYDADPTITLIDARSASLSFPSGHAAMAVAGAMAGSQLLPYSAWVWWPLAVLIAISRIYIGMHWPTDVLAGMVLGFGSSYLVLGRTVHPRIQPFRDNI